MIRAEVHITLKDGVLDPQGVTLQRSLKNLGYQGVEAVRFGKFIQLWFDADDPRAVEPLVEKICQQVLSNPVIETYRYQLVPEP